MEPVTDMSKAEMSNQLRVLRREWQRNQDQRQRIQEELLETVKRGGPQAGEEQKQHYHAIPFNVFNAVSKVHDVWPDMDDLVLSDRQEIVDSCLQIMDEWTEGSGKDRTPPEDLTPAMKARKLLFNSQK